MRLRLSGTWFLSDEHAPSSYGRPVLVDNHGQEYGTGDLIEMFPSWGLMPAGRAVLRLAASKRFTDQQRTFIRAFID